SPTQFYERRTRVLHLPVSRNSCPADSPDRRPPPPAHPRGQADRVNALEGTPPLDPCSGRLSGPPTFRGASPGVCVICPCPPADSARSEPLLPGERLLPRAPAFGA